MTRTPDKPEPIPSIADTLALFNRKERHLVVQNCLGEKATELHPRFLDRVYETIGHRLKSRIQSDAWWAIDFHIDWLISAIEWYAEKDSQGQMRRRHNDSALISNTQQDVDLIIVGGCDVILIEAKGHDAWDNRQLDEKTSRIFKIAERLSTLSEFVAEAHPMRALRLHLVLLSVCEPENVKCAHWPEWARKNNRPYWFRLNAPEQFIHIDRDYDSDHKLVGWQMRPSSSGNPKRRPKH